MENEKILISACLLGEYVRYDGGTSTVSNPILNRWDAEGRLVPICPEMAGGLSTPRPPAEIMGADTESVMRGINEVRTKQGDNVSSYFLDGAQQALTLAVEHDIQMVILKEGSPSCGSSQINDGHFSGRKTAGQGITTSLLRQHGIRVFSEKQISKAAKYLESLEKG